MSKPLPNICVGRGGPGTFWSSRQNFQFCAFVVAGIRRSYSGSRSGSCAGGRDAIGCVPGRARFQEVTLGTGMVLSGGGDAGFVGDHDELGAVAPVQFAQEPTDVSLDGGDAEVQVRGDLGV